MSVSINQTEFSMTQNLKDIRQDYTKNVLREKDLDLPFPFFQNWLDEALATPVIAEPTAMILATVSNQQPSARVVLLKELKPAGFLFFTNYKSRKAAEIADNPHAALLFYWMPLERQVRIEGKVQKISRSESIAYFKTRPLGSQIGALVSPQSQVIPDRDFLENRYKEASDLYTHSEPECPNFWGGYMLKPTYFEFWQGRSSRLHDRIVFEKQAQSWLKKRLAP